MLQELLYTSAPKGLKPGSRGFCTVASTAGMAKNLAERLESLSGYRHLFQPHEAQAALNPVCFSHLRLSVGGQSYHVLSRINEAGLDYTQRPNKFAHHIALEPADLSPAGPAALLSAPGFAKSSWEGEPRVLAAGRKSPAIEAHAAPCRHWAQMTGDAGWAGILAQTATAERPPTVALLVRPGMQLLPLFAEALALLPSQLRWQTTFSTFYMKLPAGVECQWRGVFDGSPEWPALQRTPGLMILDLRQAMGKAPAGPLVEAARTGVVPTPSRAVNPTKTKQAAAASEPTARVPLVTAATEAPVPRRDDDEGYRFEPGPPPTGPIFAPRPPKGLPTFTQRPTRRRRWLIPVIAGSVVAAMLMAAVGAVVLWEFSPLGKLVGRETPRSLAKVSKSDDTSAATHARSTATSPNAGSSADPKPSGDQRNAANKIDTKTSPSEPGNVASKSVPSNAESRQGSSRTAADPNEPKPAPVASPPGDTKPPTRTQPVPNSVQPNPFRELPPCVDLGHVPKTTSESAGDPVRLPIGVVRGVNADVLDPPELLPIDKQMVTETYRFDDGTTAPSDNGERLYAINLLDPRRDTTRVATLRYAPAANPGDCNIVFTWKANTLVSPELLRLCVIRFRKGDNTHLLALRSALVVRPLVVNFDDKSTSIIQLPNPLPRNLTCEWRLHPKWNANFDTISEQDGTTLKLKPRKPFLPEVLAKLDPSACTIELEYAYVHPDWSDTALRPADIARLYDSQMEFDKEFLDRMDEIAESLAQTDLSEDKRKSLTENQRKLQSKKDSMQKIRDCNQAISDLRAANLLPFTIYAVFPDGRVPVVTTTQP